jgi:DNA mismatch repair protein MutS
MEPSKASVCESPLPINGILEDSQVKNSACQIFDPAASGTFYGILTEGSEESAIKETPNAPNFFVDLNLDQIVDAITIGTEEYNLKPYFYTPLKTLSAITYRQEIMRDLENKQTFDHITTFARQMRFMREHLSQSSKLHYKYQKESWFLDAVEIYCNAIRTLAENLSRADLQSSGLSAFRHYLSDYAGSERFGSLVRETQKLQTQLASVQYCVLIKGNAIKVRKYESEIDYSADVLEAFAKFKQGAVKSHLAKFSDWVEMNHIEERILDFVAQLYPEIFSELDRYCLQNRSYLDERIGIFDREVQFYISYLEYAQKFKRAGLHFTYPLMASDDKEVYEHDGFDLALANKLLSEKASIICNDFFLRDKERIIVVSGPNQGGKTTFARMFGQLHYLANMGCPVPGTKAKLLLFDKLFTHFEKEENIANLRGKLEDDLVRIHNIINQMTSRSIVIMNESFTSTTLQDAIFLSEQVMRRIVEADLLCVCVTFLDELALFAETVVSMVSTVVPDNPASRTFKIIRKRADGLAYAISIAEKYRLTYDCLLERL